MKIEFQRPTIWVSHPIEGSTGNIQDNCKKAAAAVRRLRRVFSEVDWYCPGEHDLALMLLYDWGLIKKDDILEADLDILYHCNGWVGYFFEDSVGCVLEHKEAVAYG